jgi:hypothetical protein
MKSFLNFILEGEAKLNRLYIAKDYGRNRSKEATAKLLSRIDKEEKKVLAKQLLRGAKYGRIRKINPEIFKNVQKSNIDFWKFGPRTREQESWEKRKEISRGIRAGQIQIEMERLYPSLVSAEQEAHRISTSNPRFSYSKQPRLRVIRSMYNKYSKALMNLGIAKREDPPSIDPPEEQFS